MEKRVEGCARAVRRAQLEHTSIISVWGFRFVGVWNVYIPGVTRVCVCTSCLEFIIGISRAGVYVLSSEFYRSAKKKEELIMPNRSVHTVDALGLQTVCIYSVKEANQREKSKERERRESTERERRWKREMGGGRRASPR